MSPSIRKFIEVITQNNVDHTHKNHQVIDLFLTMVLVFKSLYNLLIALQYNLIDHCKLLL